MPRTTETYNLEEERDRIDNKLDELADEVAELDEGNLLRGQKIEEANSLERHLTGILWALNPDDEEDRDPYTEVTLGSLTASEHADVRDSAPQVDSPGKQSNEGGSMILYAAKGVVEAPFLDQNNPAYNEKIAAVGDLQPQFAEWLAERVDELTTPDVEGNGFGERVAERMSE